MKPLVFHAPAPVRVTVNGDKPVLMDGRDTLTIYLNGQPSELTFSFDWDVDPLDLASRYKLNEQHGKVDVFYENAVGGRATYSPDHGWLGAD